MKVRDIFEQLSQGEFRGYAIGGSEQMGIQESDYHKIIPHINLGLTELHKRFLLKTNNVIIQQYSQISRYLLHSDYAQTNTASTKTPKYIIDTPYAPFNEYYFLKTEAVYAEDGGQYSLNKPSDPYSIYTPADNIIEIPFADENNAVSIQYRANHPKLESTGVDVLNQEVDISPTYLEALLLYISGRYLTTSGNPEQAQEGNNALAKFEISLMNITRNGLDVRDDLSHTKLEERGWV